jgi:hypothetical protein
VCFDLTRKNGFLTWKPKTKKKNRGQPRRDEMRRTRVIISKKTKDERRERKEGGDRDKKVIIIQKTKHRFLSLVKKNR